MSLINYIIRNEEIQDKKKESELKRINRIMNWEQFEDETIIYLRKKIGRLQERNNNPTALEKATLQLVKIYNKRENKENENMA